MRRLVAPAVAALAFVLAPAAEAKLCVRIQAPAVAAHGDSVVLQIRTFLPNVHTESREVDCSEPLVIPVGVVPQQLEILGARGGAWLVELRRTRAQPSVWRASFRFPRPGRYRIRYANWTDAPPGWAPAVTVRVR